MHEESLIRNLLIQVAGLARVHRAEGVEEIEVEVGPLSNAEPLLLQSAFERLVENSPLRGASLLIRNVGLTVACENCCAVSELQNYRFSCAACGSHAIKILRGDCLTLLNVKLLIEDLATET